MWRIQLVDAKSLTEFRASPSESMGIWVGFFNLNRQYLPPTENNF